jgi:hypothetical protein
MERENNFHFMQRANAAAVAAVVNAARGNDASFLLSLPPSVRPDKLVVLTSIAQRLRFAVYRINGERQKRKKKKRRK